MLVKLFSHEDVTAGDSSDGRDFDGDSRHRQVYMRLELGRMDYSMLPQVAPVARELELAARSQSGKSSDNGNATDDELDGSPSPSPAGDRRASEVQRLLVKQTFGRFDHLRAQLAIKSVPQV